MEKRRILLFGRTGSGKSTIANMLARGHLDAPLLFKTSSGVRGETLHVQREECDEMVVVDTVGLGESEHGRVSTQEAQRILYNFFTKVEEGFHYFAFVRKWGRNDLLDEQLWKFFRQAFKGAEENFLVIITHFDKPEAQLKDPETNRSLVKMYAPCRTWVCVDFPDDGSAAAPEALRRVSLRRRTRSLERLKQAMVQLWGPPVAPDVCLQLRVGRVLLVGRRTAAKGIVANLLVKGDFHILDSDLPFPIFAASADAATSSQPFTEGKGRRWEVVAMHSFDSYIGPQQDHRKLARTLAASILDTLMQEAGFSHVVFVHESGHGHKQDELIDKRFWQMMLAFLSGTMRKERLVLVIAASSTYSWRPEPTWTSEIARFKDCQNLVFLDIPTVDHPIDVSIESLDRSQLDSARRVLEQVLQKEVDTQFTFFNLDINLSRRDKLRIIEEVSEAYLTPVVMRALSNNKDKSGLPVFKVLSNPALNQLSSAYRKIVNKDEMVNKVRHMWNEQPAEAVAEASAAAAEAAADGVAANDPNFCKSAQLVVGKDLNHCYLTLKGRWNEDGTLRCIKVTVESHDQGHQVGSSRSEDQGT